MNASPIDSNQTPMRALAFLGLINNLLAGRLRQFYFWMAVISLVYFMALVPPFLIGKVIDFLTSYQTGQPLGPLFQLCGAISVVMLGAAVVRLQAKDELAQLAIRAGYQARVRGFDRLMNHSVLWHQGESTGNKVQRIAMGSASLEVFLKIFFAELLTVFIHAVGVIISFFYVSWHYGLIGAVYLASFLSIQFYFYIKVRALLTASKQAGETATGSYVEGASNILTIKTLNLERNISAAVASKEKISRDLKLRSSRLTFIKWRCFQLLTGLFMGGFILKVSLDVVHGQTSAGDLAMLFAYFRTLQESAGDSTGLFDSLIDNWIAIGRMAPIFEHGPTESRGTARFPEHWETIEFRDVQARYPGKHGGLKRCSFSIRRGEHVGIVGTSGAGKSTLAKVLLGVLPPQEGRYEIGGVEFSSISPEEVAAHISMVLQDSELFNMSLQDNITVMREIEPETLLKAVSIARLDSVVQKLDQGLETIIGERGYRLSGGERQRLGIARAICKNPEIIVLDEATSALDGETEREIHSALVSELGEKTFIIIAHRLSTLKDVDRIIVFDDGLVVEEGAPAELLDNPTSHFARMWRAQESARGT